MATPLEESEKLDLIKKIHANTFHLPLSAALLSSDLRPPSEHLLNPYVAIGGGVFYPPDALFILLL